MERSSLTADGWVPALKRKWRIAVRKALMFEFKVINSELNKQYFVKNL